MENENNTNNEPTEQNTIEPVGEPISEPTEQNTLEPVGTNTLEPVGEPVSESMEQNNNETFEQPSVTQEDNNEKPKKTKLIIICVVVCLIAGVVAFILGKGLGKEVLDDAPDNNVVENNTQEEVVISENSDYEGYLIKQYEDKIKIFKTEDNSLLLETPFKRDNSSSFIIITTDMIAIVPDFTSVKTFDLEGNSIGNYNYDEIIETISDYGDNLLIVKENNEIVAKDYTNTTIKSIVTLKENSALKITQFAPCGSGILSEKESTCGKNKESEMIIQITEDTNCTQYTYGITSKKVSKTKCE